MSMIEHQIGKLKSAKHIISQAKISPLDEIEIDKVIDDAILTIQDLSAKLAAANMEWGSAYYNGGWIPIEKRRPNVSCVLATLQYDMEDGSHIYRTEDVEVVYENQFIDSRGNNITRYVTAWMPRPEPYRKEM